MSSIANVVAASLRVLEATPSALITDIDGTISRIAARPEEAEVSEIARRSLEVLSHRLDLTAIITGRQEDVARSMVGVDTLTYVGHYALDASQADIPVDALKEAKAKAKTLLAELPCIDYEEKGYSFSLHYRHCPDGEATKNRILEFCQPLATSMGGRLVEGKQVVEMVPAGLPDKGSAVRRLLEGRGINGAVFFGDDLSDVAIFRELIRRREEESHPGLCVAVVDEETHELVREVADLHLSGVDEMEQVLVALAREVSDEGGE